MNIILFGPPGVGKSTLIGRLKSDGIRAIDLEDLYPSNIRFSIPGIVDEAVIGGADLNPKRKYTNAVKVLLTMTQKDYERRRAQRDQSQRGKGSQRRHQISDWLKGVKYDVILDVSGPVMETAAKLASLLKEVNSGAASSTST